MASSRLDCGCRRRSVRKHGHRPACALYDQERDNGHRKLLRLRRKHEEAGDPLEPIDWALTVVIVLVATVAMGMALLGAGEPATR